MIKYVKFAKDSNPGARFEARTYKSTATKNI
jgi:hypothetical protein